MYSKVSVGFGSLFQLLEAKNLKAFLAILVLTFGPNFLVSNTL